MSRPGVFASLIQSSFGSPHGNFEAVVRLANGDLWHYWRDNNNDSQAWGPAQLICSGTAYAGSLIQSHFPGSDAAGNFEVVVPLALGNGRVQLTHFWHDNQTTPDGPWQLGGPVTADGDQVLGPGCITQSSFGEHHNLEVVVPIKGADGNAVLQHFWRDPLSPDPWQRGLQVTVPGDVLTGPGCIIQSTRGVSPTAGGGDLQIVVPIMGPGGQPQLRHISRAGATGPWVTNPTPITAPGDVVAGGGVIIESDFRDHSGQGNFEVLVGLRMPPGHIEVRHFWHDTSDSPTWQRGGRVTASGSDGEPFATAGLALIQSDYPKGGPHGDFEALVEQCEQSIGCYMLYNENAQPQWVGGWIPQLQDFNAATDQGPLPEEPHVNHYDGTSKICQLIGEYDLEGWTSVIPGDHAPTGPALAVSESQSASGTTESVLFAAWANTDDKDRLQLRASTDTSTDASPDVGTKFIPSPETDDFSDARPALAQLNGKVYLAWKGSGNQQLNVAQLQYATAAGGWGNPAIGSRIGINAISDVGPALVSHGGQLVLAWKGVDNGAVNVAFWNPGTPSFTGILTFGEVTIAEPALVVSHDDRLLVAWTGTDKRVNVAELPAGGSSLTGKITLPDISEHGPTLASFNNRLFLALQQKDTNDLIIVASDDGGQTFAGRPRTPQTSALTTALAAGQQSMFWAWTGVGNEQLNVARYDPPPGRLPVTPFGTARNRTETTARIMGTDLGNQFMHGEHMCFLFGDTAHVKKDGKDDDFNLDTIAFADVSDFDPATGLALTFNPAPPIIAKMRNSQTVYSVPLDGITIDGTMFLFYSLDHIEVAPGYNSFGHTDVVNSTDDGLNFTHLYEFSREHFLNVSVAQVEGSDLGLPEFGDTLAVWGTGIYHSSEPYLAALPLSAIETGQPVRYFAGVSGGAPMWADTEDAAAPLFGDPTVAELSVRFNSYLNAWMMTYTSFVVRGVCLRLSPTPWGPWTTPLRLLHQWYNPSGPSIPYIHVPNDQPGLARRDWMYDTTVGVPPNDPANAAGIPYSPAIIEPLIRGEAGLSTTIFFTMSTWSPYTSLLMRADLVLGDLLAVGWIPGSLPRIRTKLAAVPKLGIHGRTPF
jgi:hypothetical protein